MKCPDINISKVGNDGKEAFFIGSSECPPLVDKHHTYMFNFQTEQIFKDGVLWKTYLSVINPLQN